MGESHLCFTQAAEEHAIFTGVILRALVLGMEAWLADAGKGQTDKAEQLRAPGPRRRVLPPEHAAELLTVISGFH